MSLFVHSGRDNSKRLRNERRSRHYWRARVIDDRNKIVKYFQVVPASTDCRRNAKINHSLTSVSLHGACTRILCPGPGFVDRERMRDEVERPRPNERAVRGAGSTMKRFYPSPTKSTRSLYIYTVGSNDWDRKPTRWLRHYYCTRRLPSSNANYKMLDFICEEFIDFICQLVMPGRIRSYHIIAFIFCKSIINNSTNLQLALPFCTIDDGRGSVLKKYLREGHIKRLPRKS